MKPIYTNREIKFKKYYGIKSSFLENINKPINTMTLFSRNVLTDMQDALAEARGNSSSNILAIVKDEYGNPVMIAEGGENTGENTFLWKVVVDRKSGEVKTFKFKKNGTQKFERI